MTGRVPLIPADLGPGVVAGFTVRAGGCSSGAWSGLDLALHAGDDEQVVAANRRLLADAVGSPVVFGRQVHGTRTAVLAGDAVPLADACTRDLRGELGGGVDAADGDGYDALVTRQPGLALGVLVADCVPVLLADPEAGVVATAHAGRPGLLAGVLQSVLSAMWAEGARPERVRVALGPSAGPCCYEVPQQLQDDACALLPQARARTRWGTPSLDLRAGCAAVLARAGVHDVRSVGGCTIDDETFYSYRRSPVTGRFAGVVKMEG